MTTHKNIHEAMLAAQLTLKNPKNDSEGIYKDKAGKARKYAGLPDVRNVITPILHAEGLYNAHFVKMGETVPYLETVITFAATGEQLKSKFPLLLEKQTPQGIGSAVTYARRYSLCAMLNIVGDDDDDGQSAEKPKEAPKPVAAEPKPEPIVRERIDFIKNTIDKAKDEATVKKLNADAKLECVDAKDEAAYAEILATAKDKLKQLKGE